MTVSTFIAHSNTQTTIEFILDIPSADHSKDVRATLVIENFLDECDLCVNATHIIDTTWAAVLPVMGNNVNNDYNIRLEFIVDGRIFTHTHGTLLIETDNDHESSLDTDHVRGEFPVNNEDEGDERAKSNFVYPAGQNTDEYLDDLDQSTTDDSSVDIEDIASSVTGVQGPQVSFDYSIPDFDARGAAEKIIRSILPSISKPVSGKRLLDDVTKKRIMNDPDTVALLEEKSRRVRDILNSKPQSAVV